MASAYERILASRKKFEEQAGLTEEDYAAARQYRLDRTDGQRLVQNVETARNNLDNGNYARISDRHKALNDYANAVRRLDSFTSIGGQAEGVDSGYMQQLYRQYEQSWNQMQDQIGANYTAHQIPGLVQHAERLSRERGRYISPVYMMNQMGLVDRNGNLTEAGQKYWQRNTYQQNAQEAGQEAARWGAQSEQSAAQLEQANKWLDVIGNMQDTQDARVRASNERWMQQAAQEMGIPFYTDRADLQRRIQAKADALQKSGDWAQEKSQNYIGQQMGYQAAMYQMENGEESLGAAYYKGQMDDAEDLAAQRLERGDVLGAAVAYMNPKASRARSQYSHQLYMDQKNEDILALRENPTTGPIYQAAMEASRNAGRVATLRAQAHGEQQDYGGISAQTEAEIRKLAQEFGIVVGQGDDALEAALEQVHQQQSHTVNTNIARLQAQGYDPERLRQYIQQALNEQRMDEQNAQAREFAAEHPGAASVGSSFTNLLSGGGYIATAPQAIGNALAGLTGEYDNYVPIDTNSPAFDQAQYVMAVRDEVSRNIVENGGSDFLYGVGMSMLDNVVQMAVGALTMGAGAMAGAAGQGAGAMLQAGIKAATPATLATMGLGAASQQLTQLTEAGVPSDQAYLLATLSGGIEIVTEKIGIDNLVTALGRRQASQMLRNIIQQTVAEGAEEGLAEVANLAADYLVRMDDSTILQTIEEGRRMGLTEEQANARARQIFGRQIVEAIAAGALSGAGFGGGAVATHALSNTEGARGRQILAQGTLPNLQRQAAYYGIDAKDLNENSTAREIGGVHRQVERAAQTAEQELRSWAAEKKYNKNGTDALLHAYAEYTDTGAAKLSAGEFSIAFDTAYQHGKSDATYGAEGAYLERAATDALVAGLTPGTVRYAYSAGLAAGEKQPQAKQRKAKQTHDQTKKVAKAQKMALATGVMQVEQMGEHEAVLVMPDGTRKNITRMDVRGTAAEIVSEAMDDGYSAVVVNQMLKHYDGSMEAKTYYDQFRAAMLAGINKESLKEAKQAATELPAAIVKEAHDRGRLLRKAYDLADRIGYAGKQALDDYGYTAPAEFEKFYTAGLEGKNFRQAVKELGEVSEEIKDEMQAAVRAGLRDKQGGFIYGEQERGTRSDQKSGRVHGVDPSESAGQSGSMAETGSDRESQTDGKAAAGNESQADGTREEKVSSKALGLQHGTDLATLKVIDPAKYTEEQQKIADLYAQQDISVTFVLGPIEIRQTDGSTKKARGVAVGQRNQIIVRVDADLSMEQIAVHEAKHIEYARYPGRIAEDWKRFADVQNEEDLDRWIAGYAERYGYLDGYYDIDQFIEEALCDAAADAPAPLVSEAYYQETFKPMTQKWRSEKATNLSEGAGYARQADSGGEELSIEKTIDNRPFVIVEDDILDNVPENEWVKTVKENLRNKFPNGVTIGKSQIDIDSQSRKEMTYSRYTKWLKRNDADAYVDKLRATNNADEILLATTDYINEGLNHTRDDNIDDFARGTVLMRIGGNDYQAEVIVAHRKNGKMLLYDIINLERTTIRKKETDAAKPVNPSPGTERNTASVSEDSLTNTTGNVKADLYSIGGRNAATANLEALERAEQMEKAGGSVGEIYRETGWFRGADRQWRFEIDDSTMRYYKGGDAKFRKTHPGYVRHQELTTKMLDGTITEEEYQELRDSIWHREYGRLKERVDRGNAHLDDILDHDALFEAYPQLRDVKIEFVPMEAGGMGAFSRRHNTIRLAEKLRSAPEATLIHEIQHAIQALEGFANGSSRAYWERILNEGGTIDSVRLRDATAALQRFEQDPANAEVIEARNRLNEVWDTEGARAGNALYAQYEADGMAAKVDAYEDLIWEQSSASAAYQTAFPFDLYENTAGEQEARDTAARRNMTAEQRRQQMPQTGNKDTVFAEGSMAAMSEVEQTPEQQLKTAQQRIKALEGVNQYLRQQMTITTEYTPDPRQIRKAAKTFWSEYGGRWSREELEQRLSGLWKTAQKRTKGEISFDELMEQTRVLASELVQNYLDKDNQDAETIREIKQYVRTTRMYLSPDLRADLDQYGGYAAVRKANFGRIRLANSGEGVDQVYQVLSEQYPEYFPETIWNPADQLMQIIDVVNDGTEVLQRSPLDGMPDALDYMTNKVLWELGLVNAAPKTKADKILEEAGNRSNREQILQAAGAHEQEQMEQLEAFYKQQLQKVKNDREDKIQKVKERYQQKAQEERNWKAEQEVKRKLLYHAGKLKRMSRKTSPEQQRQIEEIFGDINTLCQRMTGYTVVRDYVQGMSTEQIRPEGYQDQRSPRRMMSPEEASLFPDAAGNKIVDTEDLKRWYGDQKQNNPDFVPDKRIEEILENWDAKQINMMSVQEAQELLDVALNIENEIRTQKQLIDAKDKREIYQQVQQIIGDVNSTRGKYDNLLSRGFTGWITENTLSPVRMIQRMTGYHDADPMYQATIALQQGEMKMLDYQRRANELFKPFTDDKKFMDYLAGKGKKQQPITIGGMDEQGNIVEVKITPDMRVALYLHSLNYQNLRHIQRGGLTVPNYEAYVNGKLEEAHDRAIRLRLTPSQVRQITGSMPERELAYAKRLEKYFNVMSKTEINETSVKLKGYEIAKTNHYYPIETNKDFVVKEFDSLKFDGSLENMGFTKERIEGGNPIMLGNASATLARSIKQHSMYTGLAIPLRNFNKLRGVSIVASDAAGAVKYQQDSLMDTIRRKWGKSGLDYIEKMVADLSGVKPQQDKSMEVLNKLRSNYAGAVLELNPSTAVKQLIAYPSAASVLGWDAMAVGLNKWERVDLNEVNRYTPILWHRMQGYIDSDLGDYVANKKHKPRGLNWNQAVDVAVVKRIWKASEWKVAHDNRELVRDREAWMKATAELFNQVMLQSQANYTTMQRGQILRTDNVFLRSIAMFKTEPFQSFNVLYDAMANEAAKRRQLQAARQEAERSDDDAATERVAELEQAHRAAKHRIAQAVPAVLTSNLLEALITFAWAFFRGKEDEWEDEETGEITAASFFKRLGMRTMGNLSGIVPFGAELAEVFSAVIMGDTYYGIENMETSVIADAMTNFVSLTNTVKGWMETPEEGEEKQLEAYDIVLEILDQSLKLGTLLGVPTENVAKLLKGVTRWALIAAMGEAEGEYWYRRFTSQTTGSGHAKEDLDALYQTASSGDMESYHRLYQDILRYKDEESVQKGLVSRIRAATEAGQIDAETALQLMMQVTGTEDPDEIYWKVQGWQYMQQTGESGFSKYDRVYDAIYDGTGFDPALQELLSHGVSEKDARSEIRSQIGAWYKGTSTDELTITEQQAIAMLQQYGGKSAEDAQAQVLEWKCFVETGIAYSDIRESVLNGTITANQASQMLQKYGGKDAETAQSTAASYDFVRQHPELGDRYEPGFVNTVAEKYAVYGSGIDAVTYAEFVEFAENTSADKDDNGNWISGSRKAKIVDYIAAIPGLTPEQRNNLMLTDYSTYNLDDVPW